MGTKGGDRWAKETFAIPGALEAVAHLAVLGALPRTQEDALRKADATVAVGRRLVGLAGGEKDTGRRRVFLQAAVEVGWIGITKLADAVLLVDDPGRDLSKAGHEDERATKAACIMGKTKGYGPAVSLIQGAAGNWHARVFYRDDDVSIEAVRSFLEAVESATADLRRWRRKGRVKR